MMFGVCPTKTKPSTSLSVSAKHHVGVPNSDFQLTGSNEKNCDFFTPPVDGIFVAHWVPPLQWDVGRACTYMSEVELYVSKKPVEADRLALALNWLPR